MNISFSKKFIAIAVLVTVVIVTALITGQVELAQGVLDRVLGGE